jgi:hypothetical protein
VFLKFGAKVGGEIGKEKKGGSFWLHMAVYGKVFVILRRGILL